MGWAAIIYGAVILLGAVVAGPTAYATRLRHRLAPALNARPAAAAAVVGGLFLLLVLWGPTHALRTWWGIVLLGALLAAGVAALRRQTLVEFPEGAEGPPGAQVTQVAPATPAPVASNGEPVTPSTPSASAPTGE